MISHCCDTLRWVNKLGVCLGGRREWKVHACPHISQSSSPTFLSILSQATVSLIVYCSPKNQVSRSPRVRHTKSNRSFPFHFICNVPTNREGRYKQKSQSTCPQNCLPHSLLILRWLMSTEFLNNFKASHTKP